MRVAFWGVRGSATTPHSSVCRYGGNTSCVEVRVDDRLLILDAGSGLRDLGEQLLAEEASPGLDADILLTHYHWDHVQGLPYFEPARMAGNKLRLYGPRAQKDSPATLEAALVGIFTGPFFSQETAAMRSAYEPIEINPNGDFPIGSARVRTCPTNHPQSALAYRIDHEGSSVVYAPDHEPGQMDYDRVLTALARDADVFICDAHFHPTDFPGRQNGRGHGSWETAVDLALEAGVHNLVLFHHHPDRSDSETDQVVAAARARFPRCWGAAEGMMAEIAGGEIRIWARTTRGSQRVPYPATVQVETIQEGEQIFDQGVLHNLSFHGAYFVGPQHFEVNQPLYLVLDLPARGGDEAGDPTASDPQQVRLRGTVARVEQKKVNGGHSGVGVSFSEGPALDALRLPFDPGRKPD